MRKLTYAEFCANSKTILAQVDEYNQWAREATNQLLSDLGPRLHAISTEGYCGCGFGYETQLTFGRLLIHLALPWQVDGNHHEDYFEQNLKNVNAKVLLKLLVKTISQAEACIAAKNAGQKCGCIEKAQAKRTKENDEL